MTHLWQFIHKNSIKIAEEIDGVNTLRKKDTMLGNNVAEDCGQGVIPKGE